MSSKGHSIYYGYGRVNAEKAVKRARRIKIQTAPGPAGESRQLNIHKIINHLFRSAAKPHSRTQPHNAVRKRFNSYHNRITAEL
jgi:hypothetical protein